jgi:acetate---CoA ligase (ADP-forming)
MRPSSALGRMLEARSVAVVGASTRRGSFGEELMLELRRGPFDGDVYPVNPHHDEVMGLRCYADLAEIDRPVDMVLLGVPNRLLEEQMQLAAATGAGAAVIFATGFEQPRPGTAPLVERLAGIARAAGMSVCGGNCMGFLNIERGLRACGYPMPEDLRPGSITFISHSGSAFAAILHNDRLLRFNLVVSSGQEFVTTTADYIEYALGLDSTRAIGLFLETVRDPARFRDALGRAAESGVPIVALKVGRTERAEQLVAAHSGALAGNDAAFEALFDAYGVARVDTLDEMADTLELFAAGRPAGKGGFASVHDSGGERALVIDVAADVGLEFADLGRATKDRLASVLEEGLEPDNPLDAWGTGNDAEVIFSECLNAVHDDPNVAGLALGVDLTTEVWGAESYVAVALKVFADSTKPMAVLSNLASAIDPNDAVSLREAGVPVLEGTGTGLRAFRHLLAYRDFRGRGRAAPFEVDPSRRERWTGVLERGSPPSEVEALTMIAEYEVSVVRAAEASDSDSALVTARAIGYPVALKTAEGTAHKARARGVVLNVGSDAEVTAAYARLAETFGPRVTVAAMASAGVELAMGIVRDAQFGPLAMVGAGGILVELLADRRFGLPPLDEDSARRMIGGLRVHKLLVTEGCDIEAAARALMAIGNLASELGDKVEAVDVNPVIVTRAGATAVDALVIPRA